MARFGLVSPPVPGHIHPFLALAGELRARGHDTVLFHMADVEADVRARGVEFHVVGASDHPPGSLPESLSRLARLKGLAALRHTVAAIRRTTEMFCRDLPEAVRQQRVDMLLVDQTEPAGGTVAEHLGVPFVTICHALPLNREPQVPPPFTPWAYRAGSWARWRNRIGYAASDLMIRPVTVTLRRYRRRWGLPAYAGAEDHFSTLAQIAQIPSAFDLPRQALPACFQYAGPFRQVRSPDTGFPWARLDGRPPVYASLGTLQGANEAIFRCFAEACRPLPVQLVVSHGRGLGAAAAARLSELALVVDYAPQQALLARARLAITHAGLNTVMDSLAQGVPMIAVPLTFEQPGIAERIRRTGTGRVLPFRRLTPERLRAEIEQVLNSESYTKRARSLADAIRRSGGVTHAGDIIERVL